MSTIEIVMLGTSGCPWCQKAESLYKDYNVNILMDNEATKYASYNNIKINGVPFFVASNGNTAAGFMSPEQLMEKLNITSSDLYKKENFQFPRENFYQSNRPSSSSWNRKDGRPTFQENYRPEARRVVRPKTNFTRNKYKEYFQTKTFTR